MPSATVHIVTGLPGAGKTFLATRLGVRLKAIVINTDCVFGQFFPERKVADGDWSAAEREKVYDEMVRRIQNATSGGRDVILDGSYRFRRHRLSSLSTAVAAGFRVSVIHVTADDDVAKRRLAARSSHEQQVTSPKAFEYAKAEYEIPVGAFLMSNDSDGDEHLETRKEEYAHMLDPNRLTPTREWLTAMWSIQDNLLQWYRAIFLAGQTVLFAAAIAVLQSPPSLPRNLFLWVFALSGFLVLFFWKKVARHRALNVNYWQLRLLQLELGTLNQCTFQDFLRWENQQAHSTVFSDEVWTILRGSSGDYTRRFFQIGVPILLGAGWLFLLVRAFIR